MFSNNLKLNDEKPAAILRGSQTQSEIAPVDTVCVCGLGGGGYSKSSLSYAVRGIGLIADANITSEDGISSNVRGYFYFRPFRLQRQQVR